MPYNRTGAALGREFGLGNFWDDVYGVAQKVGIVADTISQVKQGNKSIAVVPSSGTSLVTPAGQFGVGVPVNWTLYAMIGLGAYLLLRKGR
jgi:hypothetical protein